MPVTIETIQVILAGLFTAIALVTCIHALLNKPTPRSATLWIIICLLFPIGGVILYLFFGINRLNHRAQQRAAVSATAATPELLAADHPESNFSDYESLIRTADQLTGLPLVTGCQLQPLFNGDEAFPEMLAAINRANNWIYLSSYIFDYRGVGQDFITALADAYRRGVGVRVIIDGIGEWYDGGKTRRKLCKLGVNTRAFLPPRLIPPQLAINLRNHRKLLLVDGIVGFVGGMNIRPQHIQDFEKKLQIQDFTVKLHGPILQQLTQVASDDWRYVTGEQWRPVLPASTITGNSLCRSIADGPEQALSKLLTLLLSAVTSAHRSIRIITPYFLPPHELDALLQVAARSTIEVTVILPEHSDHRIVHWASLHRLPTIIDAGINVYFQPPPFAHTKLLIIDDSYVQFGSANIDTRSLRLNFELVVESYDTAFANQMIEHFDYIRSRSQQLKSALLNRNPLWKRIRNASCWLLSPNL